MKYQRIITAMTVGVTAWVLCSCGTGSVKDIPVTSATAVPTAAATAPAGEPVSAGELAGLSDSYDTYLKSFVTEVDGFVSGDFDQFLKEVRNTSTATETAAWKERFSQYADQTKHWYDEFKAAQMIVPENQTETYNQTAQAVYALGRTFEVYADLPESGEQFQKKQQEFLEACEAVKVLWTQATANVK